MIAIIATFDVREGSEAAFEAEFAGLAAKVRANEPGNTLYRLVRVRRLPGTYRVMELYQDKDALRVHGGTDHFTAGMAALKPLLKRDPEIEMLDTVD